MRLYQVFVIAVCVLFVVEQDGNSHNCASLTFS